MSKGSSDDEINTSFTEWATEASPIVKRRYGRLMSTSIGPYGVEDAIQVSLMRLQKLMMDGSVTSYEQFLAYLTKSVAWRILDYRRHSSLFISEADASPSDYMTESSPEVRLEIREQVEKTLRALSSKNRKIFDLTVEGFNSNEIAKKVGVTAATVRSVQRRLRQALSKNLEVNRDNHE